MSKKQLVIVVVLFACLLGSTFAFVEGIKPSSGSWGTIRFLKPDEVVSQSESDVVNTTFTWTPNYPDNNAILSVSLFLEYKITIPAPLPQGYSGKLNFYVFINDVQINANALGGVQTSTPYTSSVKYHAQPNIIPNQPHYVVRFTFYAAANSYCSASIKNLNIIITVADGMMPNQYYKV